MTHIQTIFAYISDDFNDVYVDFMNNVRESNFWLIFAVNSSCFDTQIQYRKETRMLKMSVNVPRFRERRGTKTDEHC